jgi:hypothetical protein
MFDVTGGVGGATQVLFDCEPDISCDDHSLTYFYRDHDISRSSRLMSSLHFDHGGLKCGFLC